MLTYVLGFSFALLLLNFANLEVDLNVIQFAIPSLAMVLVFFYFFRTRFSKSILEFLSYTLLLLFSFLNGLGVYKHVTAVIEDNVNNMIPLILTVLGASVALTLMLSFALLLKLGVQRIKKLNNQKWEFVYVFIGSCIALYVVLGKIFV